jgi:hypothetical protein
MQFGTEDNAVRAKEDIKQISTLLYEKSQVKHEGPRSAHFRLDFRLAQQSFE